MVLARASHPSTDDRTSTLRGRLTYMIKLSVSSTGRDDEIVISRLTIVDDVGNRLIASLIECCSLDVSCTLHSWYDLLVANVMAR
jgi:hypothetical protein